MSLTTITTTETIHVWIPPSTTTIVETIITTTSTSYTTLPATPGQTLIIFFPIDPPPTSAETVIVTVKEVDILLQAPHGNIWTTLTIQDAIPTSPQTPGVPYNPIPQTFVVPPISSGWDSWSQAQKGGLISGVILFVLLVMGLLWYLHKRRKQWIAAQWANGPARAGMQVMYYPYWGGRR